MQQQKPVPQGTLASAAIGDVAVIGMFCRFPGAANPDEFWHNLIQARSSITEIPSDRWDWQSLYGEAKPGEKKTKVKWGGFISDIDKFDPFFFKIAPIEANYTDPQHRIFLQAVYAAIEDAGYNPASLAGQNIGVYAGVSKNDYAELMREHNVPIISFVSTGTVHSILSNRVSFSLDFRGKSESVDTACSSFLVALNNAVHDIRSGYCTSAVVGGVNAILAPTMYISHNQSGMLSSDGLCKTFDESANGYVRAEGVGVVFVKDLNQATQDNDQILGIIKGCAVAHGGRANSLTSPSVVAQAEVVSAAIKDADIDAKSISYIECHGTATPLGDPIEISALKKAFVPYLTENTTAFCGLGSVKSNIGHLECAAGAAGLIKLLLCFKNQQLPPLLHHKKLNPYIELDDSPFFIVDKPTKWQAKSNGHYKPLRAGLSSFGMGGVNAHVIVEQPPLRPPHEAKSQPYPIVLSAKKGRLQAQASQLLAFLKGHTPAIDDLSFTLMFGRHAFDERLSFIAETLDEVRDKLSQFLANQPGYYFSGFASEHFKADFDDDLLTNVKTWAKGGDIDWPIEHFAGQRISLPTYPFAKRRCWYDGSSEASQPAQTQLADKLTSDIELTPTDARVTDHVVQGQKMLPGAGFLALLQQSAKSSCRFTDIFWLNPLAIGDETIGLALSQSGDELKLSDSSTTYYSAMIAAKIDTTEHTVDINAIEQSADEVLLPAALYPKFEAYGLNYGPQFQVIERLHLSVNQESINKESINQQSANQALVQISSKASLAAAILDGLFQAAVALSIHNGTTGDAQYVPYSLAEFECDGAIDDIRYGLIEQTGGFEPNARLCQFNLLGLDEHGKVVARLNTFSKRALNLAQQAEKNTAFSTLYYSSTWQPASLDKSDSNGAIVAINLDDSLKAELTQQSQVIELSAAQDLTAQFAELKAHDTTFDRVVVGAVAPGKQDLTFLLGLIQAMLSAKVRQNVALYYVARVKSDGDYPLIDAAGGLARTLKFENAKLSLQVVSVAGETDDIGQKLSAIMAMNAAPMLEHRIIDGEHLVRQMVEVDLPQTKLSLEQMPVKHRGVYVISGGAGGLGRLFALHIAKSCNGKVLLLGRRQQDERIAQLLEDIATAGGEAIYQAVDISDKAALKAAIDDTRTRFGAINGVLHASGLIEDSFILQTQADKFERILAPKIDGALNLDSCLAKDPLDFFALFSSVAALMPNQGQCGYAAANAFIDSFSEQRNKRGANGKTLAINWPLWANGGMGVSESDERHLKDEFGMKPLASNHGLAIFNQLLSLDGHYHHMLCMPGDLPGAADKINQHFNIAAQLLDDTKVKTLLQTQLKLFVSLQLPMPLDDVSMQGRFTDWGVDSLAYVGLSKAINQLFGLSIKPTLFFECDNLEQVCDKLLIKHETAINQSFAKFGRLSERNLTMAMLDVDKSQPQQKRYSRRFDNQEFYMVDHVVEGKYNVPGACYIEMARQAGALAKPDKAVICLENNFWAKQLSSKGPAFTAYIQLNEQANASDYEIYSDIEGTRTVHATGRIVYQQKASVAPLGHIDLASVRSRCTKAQSPDEVYRQIHAEGLKVGETFMPMRSIVLNEAEALAELQLPTSVANTLDDYLLHPTMLTGVFQTALINNRFDGNDERHFIPVAIERLQLAGCIGAECYVYSKAITTGRNNPDLKKFDIWVCDKEGEVLALLEKFTIKNHNAAAKVNVNPAIQVVSNSDHQALEQGLKQMLAPAIGVSPDEIESHEPFETYGINSLMIVALNKVVEQTFGPGHSKTLFFENKTLQELMDYFIEEHSELVDRLFPQAPSQTEKVKVAATDKAPVQAVSSVKLTAKQHSEIAIVGLAGRYPGADDLDALWQNLIDGKQSVTKVPRQRLGYLNHYETTELDSALADKWGGFIADIDKFDPLFFNISPKEAQRIDPQERLLLQTAWHCIEDAGFSRQGLNQTAEKVGVFVGALWQPYTALGVQASLQGQPIGPSGLLYNTANRVSYYFDFNGPSLAVDTACSGSLTALHLACQSIQLGESDAALVGGVNLSLDASKYLFLEQNDFLSDEGKCRAFGADGNGYVPGEGVGMALIMPLALAQAEGCHIYGKILASSVNHGGKTNGYTVPNPNAQAALIANALEKAGVDPRSISYVEAHGTGTSLGDPIEISGLAKAYGGKAQDKQYCAIGSIKTNIGHLEACAGMAGLSKILLQLKAKTLVPSLHSSRLNPNIDFSQTPFVVQQNCAPWQSDGPRRAALSSFGAGGANAHVVIEEYNAPVQNQGVTPTQWLLPLSAKSPQALSELAGKLKAHMQSQSCELTALCYTLQVGREAMAHRAAMVVGSTEQAIALLQALEQGIDADNLYYSKDVDATAKALVKGADFKQNQMQWLTGGNLGLVASCYCAGATIDWSPLYGGQVIKRLSLPLYPFARQSYWLPDERELVVSNVETPKPAMDPSQHQLALYQPSWQTSALAEGGDTPKDILFLTAVTDTSFAGVLKQRYPKSKIINVTQAVSLDKHFSVDVYQQIFTTLQTLIKQKTGKYSLVAIVEDTLSGAFYGLTALLKTLVLEKVIKQGKTLTLASPLSFDIIKAEIGSFNQRFEQLRYLNGERLSMSYQSQATPQATTLVRAGAVILITGGLGAIGQSLCRHLAKLSTDMQLVLCGRSHKDDVSQPLAALKAQGISVAYIQTDITNRHECQTLKNAVQKQFGALSGIIHGAGCIEDSLFLRKSPSQLSRVLRVKMQGAVNLDTLYASEALDWFVCLSSASSIFGNVGQSDYALANGFLDGLMHHRQKLVNQGKRLGQSLSINWPLWADGGMQVDSQTQAHFEKLWGVVPMPTDMGVSSLFDALSSNSAQVLAFYGEPDNIAVALSAQKPEQNQPEIEITKPAISNVDVEQVEQKVKQCICALLMLDESALEKDTNIADYGFDSVSFTALAKQLSDGFNVELNAGSFYEYETIEQIVAFIRSQQPTQTIENPVTLATVAVKPQETAKPVPATSPAEQQPIAIIGLHGRFPGAEDINSFWQQLLDKQVNVKALNHDSYRFEDGELGEFQSYRSGLIDGVDKFDAEFFAIDEAEAKEMDPQQRLLMQSVWSAVEDAGLDMNALSKCHTGLFIGVGSSDYLQLMCAAKGERSNTQVGVSPSMLANRISYQLNLRGPSEICDTACSSSIVAVHRAMRSLHERECDMALVGGVNLLLSLRPFKGLKALGFLSPSSQTHSFDARADGYVRGEGVGTVLLKPLALAEQDHDAIYAVLKGSAVYHGGKANLSLLSPNKTGQIEAMVKAYQRAGISPDEVSYIEAHGTGTSLGDPAEMSAFKQAFKTLGAAEAEHRCGIGTLKPNIGHLEAASGIASLIKLVMALYHRKKPPVAGFEKLNPGMNLSQSPFYVVENAEAWTTVDGTKRTASLNSYGFGGVNAHLVLQEYGPNPKAHYDEGYEVVMLSAMDENALNRQVGALKLSLADKNGSARLKEVSFSLAARKALKVRLAIVCNSIEALKQALESYRFDSTCFIGQNGKLNDKPALDCSGNRELANAAELAQNWACGEGIDIQSWFGEDKPYRVNLPSYPFSGKSYWYNR